MKALILIGGFGTRLRPLTCTTPKPMLPVVNRPFLEYQLELLKRHRVKEVIFCLSYLSHKFEDYFGTGKKWGMKIRYIHEKHPLGTGGAVRNAAKYLTGSTLVLNGDILTDINISEMIAYHKQKKAAVTIALNRVKDPTIYGLVETNKQGRIQRFIEKPSWDEVTVNTINSGVYIFEPSVVDQIPAGVNFSLERGLFPNLLEKGHSMVGYVFRGYWLDIGNVEKYLQAHFDLMSRSVDYELPGKMVQGNIWVGKNFKRTKDSEINGCLVCGNNVRIGAAAQLGGNVCLGNNVRIGNGVNISDSVVLDGAKIGDGVRLEKVIIGAKSTIEANASISPLSVVGDKSLITKYSKV